MLADLRMCRLAVSMMCLAATCLYRSCPECARFILKPVPIESWTCAQGWEISRRPTEEQQRIRAPTENRSCCQAITSLSRCMLSAPLAYGRVSISLCLLFRKHRNCLSSIISSMPDVKRVKANAVNETFNSDFLHKVKVSEKIGTVYSVCPERCVPHG